MIGQWVYALVINENNLIAGTGGNGVYISTNNGNEWTQTQLSRVYVYTLAVNGSTLNAGTVYGMLKSTDGGSNWIQILNETILTIILYNNIIIAGSWDNGTYLTKTTE